MFMFIPQSEIDRNPARHLAHDEPVAGGAGTDDWPAARQLEQRGEWDGQEGIAGGRSGQRAASFITKLPVLGPAVVSGLTQVTIVTSFQVVAASARAVGLLREIVVIRGSTPGVSGGRARGRGRARLRGAGAGYRRPGV